MLKKQLLKFIHSRLFIFSNGQFFQLLEGDLTLTSFEILKKTPGSFLIIGKDHYKEVDKRYPVSNVKDLKDILKYQTSNADMFDSPKFFEDHTILPTIELDREAKAQVEECRWTVWLPESWVLNFPRNELFYVVRANVELFALKLADKLMLSPLKGPFKSKSYFLMSTGASENVQEHSLNQKQYTETLVRGIESISQAMWLNILKSQHFKSKIATSFDWLSAVTGSLVGILLFQGVYWGVLSFQEASLDNEISKQNVTQVVRLQKQFEESKMALSRIQNGGFDKLKIANLWDVMLMLMESKVNLIRINSIGEEFELHLDSGDATNTLESLRKSVLVKDVRFSTPVRQSGARETFGVVLTVKTRADL